ncbi:protein NDH-DEPENDENT CYCLIC ELECTRON FLOW 5 [Carica papaya]|uniref:protein NDH-DEPENDENT CYCLIC ELECTRON FLOW 5 n=1 Tax=Carica papaya TaxID=3649 RepID=UPI000B8D1284|nr:protein NDH-DEPENDENT CYCLIC ELECTRON FLOW 5 [Carica papaya]
MVYTALFSSRIIHISSKRPTENVSSFHPQHPFHLQCIKTKREFPLPSVASIPYQPINVDYLEREFSGHGVTFKDIVDSCIAKLVLENGSTASLMLPSGLITSYKVPMWHGGKVELLHTSVSEGEDGGAVIEGGVSLAFKFESDGENSWYPTTWALHDIRGNSQESIQVELISTHKEKVEMKHIINLQEDILSTELVITNKISSALQLSGSFLSHLTVSTPDATYAVGLEGSNFISRPPFLSKFGIVPQEEEKLGFGQLWDEIVHKGPFSGLVSSAKSSANELENTRRKSEEGNECEENENYKQLHEKMSRIYTSAPQSFTLIDRGRRSSVVVGREGLDEVYMFSPGSSHEYYSKYAFVCIGQSAMLKPITLKAGDVWRGVQHLHNPNL